MVAEPLDALAALTLPTGERWAAAWKDDPWIVRDVLTPILERNADGPRYRVVWIELSRGSAKTSLVAGVALVAALTAYGTNVFPMASDQDQARLILEALGGQCRRNPKLGQRLKQARDLFAVKQNGSFIRVLASDAPSGFGLGPDARRLLFICDELTQWRTRDMFDMAMTTLPKVRDAQLIVITNAGVRGSWQEEARRQVEAMAADGRAYLFAAEGVIASWLRAEDLALAEAGTHPTTFARYFGNIWVDAASAFITREDLGRCVDPTWRPQVEADGDGSRYVYAVDLGLTRDRTARAVAHYDPGEERVVLDDLRVWQGTKDDPVLITDIEADMERCDAAFRQPVMLADPWQMQGTIQRLAGRYRLQEFTFTAENVRRLSETLYSLLHNGQLRLYPDAELERELLRLEAKETSYGWRIDHRSGGFSDRAIALGMACLHAVQQRPLSGLLGDKLRPEARRPEMAGMRTRIF